jgi:aryl-alcohol dehydrogenase-like predicted oxidoreductase
MGLTGSYNAPLGEEAVAAVVAHAFRRGVTFFDTSDAYGPHTNETLLGKALKQLPREQVQVATKFGIGQGAAGMTVCGTPEYVRACCEASLRRLDAGYIDLYYQHRVDTNVPIEDTVCISWPHCSRSACLADVAAAVAIMNYCAEIDADW